MGKNDEKIEKVFRSISKTLEFKVGEENNIFVNNVKNLRKNEDIPKNIIDISQDNYFTIDCDINKKQIEHYKLILRKYTKISNEFIDDFFGLYNPKDKYNFCINLENIAKWLNVRKNDIKNTLQYSYKENIDYKITKNKSDGKVGKPKETILLTPKCFKLMAMQSKTKKAVQVREYYYELENILDKYKNYIIEGLKEKIALLENNQKPKINPKKGVIYIIETADDIGHYKIGRTKDLKKRLQSYNGDKKDNIIPIYIYETDDVEEIERCIKHYGKKYRYRKYKEIYKANINMLKDLINECGEFNEKTNLKYKYKSNNKNQKGGIKQNYNYYIAVYQSE